MEFDEFDEFEYYRREFTGAEQFVGNINELIIWTARYPQRVYVFAPNHRKINSNSRYRHDVFAVEHNQLVLSATQDLHIELYEMCLLYQLCQEHGILKERV